MQDITVSARQLGPLINDATKAAQAFKGWRIMQFAGQAGDAGKDVRWAPVSDVTIRKQLEGTGQIAGFKRSPNLKGYDAESLLAKTPKQIEEMYKRGEIDSKLYTQIKKLFQGRDLRHGN